MWRLDLSVFYAEGGGVFFENCDKVLYGGGGLKSWKKLLGNLSMAEHCH